MASLPSNLNEIVQFIGAWFEANFPTDSDDFLSVSAPLTAAVKEQFPGVQEPESLVQFILYQMAAGGEGEEGEWDSDDGFPWGMGEEGDFPFDFGEGEDGFDFGF